MGCYLATHNIGYMLRNRFGNLVCDNSWYLKDLSSIITLTHIGNGLHFSFEWNRPALIPGMLTAAAGGGGAEGVIAPDEAIASIFKSLALELTYHLKASTVIERIGFLF